MTASANAEMMAPASRGGLAGAAAHEQTRARYPDERGLRRARRRADLLRACTATATPTVLLLPTWSIVHSRLWKPQIPYLARHYRVVTFDGRGNGRSDRPAGAEAYRTDEFVARRARGDGCHGGTERACSLGVSCGALWATILAADHPERVERVGVRRPAVRRSLPGQPRAARLYALRRASSTTDEGWAKYNSHYWLKDYRGFLEFFFAQCFPEPHSTKQIEDCVGWALETGPETLADTTRAVRRCRARSVPRRARGCAAGARHPRGRDADPSAPAGRGAGRATGGQLVTLEGAGHMPDRARPGEGQPADARVRLRRAPPRPRAGGEPRPRPASARCTSRRRSASATRAATSRSRASCAACTPIWRSTGSPSTR